MLWVWVEQGAPLEGTRARVRCVAGEGAGAWVAALPLLACMAGCFADGAREVAMDPRGRAGLDVGGLQAGVSAGAAAASGAGVGATSDPLPALDAGVDASVGVVPPAVDAAVVAPLPDAAIPVVDAGAGFDAATPADAGTDAAPPPRSFDAGSDPGRNAVVAGGLCDRLSEIQCAGEAFCCDAPGRDFAACKTALFEVCQSDLKIDGIAMRANAGFDASHAASAYAELERLASECDPGIAAFGESLAGLRGIFAGTVATDGTCANLAPVDPVLAGAALASCTSPATHACLPGLLRWDCTPRGGVGASCFTDVNCLDGLYCPNPDLLIGVGHCAARKAVGVSCTLPNECESLSCQGGACAAPGVQAAYCLQ